MIVFKQFTNFVPPEHQNLGIHALTNELQLLENEAP